MEEVKIKMVYCPVCTKDFDEKNLRNVPYPTEGHSLKIGKPPEKIVFCPDCEVGLAYPNLTEDQLGEIYATGEYWKDLSIRQFRPKDFPGHYALARSRWGFVADYLERTTHRNEISILDIGAGHGFLGMVAAKNQSITLKKYDMVEADSEIRKGFQSAWHKKFSHIDMLSVASLKAIKDKYDMVVLSHILEHVIDPREFLKDISEYLSPDGIIFIDVPHSDYLFKKDVFPHVGFFNKASLSNLIKKNGYTLEQIDSFGRNREHSPCGYQYSNGFVRLIAGMIYKLRSVLPEFIPVEFYRWYFGTNIQAAEGTWLRAIARK